MDRKRTIKGLRIDLGLKQADVAKRLGCAPSAYNAMEQLDNEEICAELAKTLKVKKIEVVVEV